MKAVGHVQDHQRERPRHAAATSNTVSSRLVARDPSLLPVDRGLRGTRNNRCPPPASGRRRRPSRQLGLDGDLSRSEELWDLGPYVNRAGSNSTTTGR
jgi:hypothetical protein